MSWCLVGGCGLIPRLRRRSHDAHTCMYTRTHAHTAVQGLGTAAGGPPEPVGEHAALRGGAVPGAELLPGAPRCRSRHHNGEEGGGVGRALAHPAGVPAPATALPADERCRGGTRAAMEGHTQQSPRPCGPAWGLALPPHKYASHRPRMHPALHMHFCIAVCMICSFVHAVRAAGSRRPVLRRDCMHAHTGAAPQSLFLGSLSQRESQRLSQRLLKFLVFKVRGFRVSFCS